MKRLPMSKTPLCYLFSDPFRIQFYAQARLYIRVSMLIFLSLFVMQTSFSASVSKLYEASIKVDGDKPENQLINEAFTQVLVKVSGRSDVKSSPAYATMLKQAESAISQFRYDYKAKPFEAPSENDTTDTTKPETSQAENAPEQKQKWFWVRFNAKTINSLLKEAQLPVWGKIRPETLIWFSQEIKGKRHLLGQHDQPEIYAVFKQQAEQRGLALIFPFLDLQDQSSVSSADIWGNFNDAILLASRRYQAQSTLTVRLFKEPSGLWLARWSLLMLGEVQAWETRNTDRDQTLSAGIDELANKLSRQFTQVADAGNEAKVLVQINNIGDFKDFQTVDDYLRNLATIKSIALLQVTQDRALFAIEYLSSKESLIQEIRLGDLLNSVERTIERTIEHSGALQNNSNTNDSETDKGYQAVILDDLDKQAKDGPASEREKALNAMNQPPENPSATVQNNASQNNAYQNNASQNSAENAPLLAQKKVEVLTPELEYWLAR